MRFVRVPFAHQARRLLCVLLLLGVAPGCASEQPIMAHLPAEYAPVQSIVVSWPAPYPDMWPMYRRVVQQLRDAADVLIVVPDEQIERSVRDYIRGDDAASNTLDFVRIPTHSLWIRDYGPLFVQSAGAPKSRVGVDLRYIPLSRDSLGLDDPVPLAMTRELQMTLLDAPLILEGGNVLADGHGACFLSESVRYRNQDYSEQEIRDLLRRLLGCKTAIILPVLAGEPTGHVGLYLKLADAHTALVAKCSFARDRNCATLDSVAEQIERTAAPGGGTYRVVRVPYPWLADASIGRLYASYANGVIANDYAFVPQFGLREDVAALQAYREALPQLRIVGVDVAPLLRLGGALQCITLPIPAAPPVQAQS